MTGQEYVILTNQEQVRAAIELLRHVLVGDVEWYGISEDEKRQALTPLIDVWERMGEMITVEIVEDE